MLYVSGLAFTVGFFGVWLLMSKQSAIGTMQEEQQIEAFIQEVIELTNGERKARDLPPLKLQNNLRVAAMWLAEDMAEKNYVSHTDSLGRSLSERLSEFGYMHVSDAAENIARGAAVPRKVVDGWMKNEQHRANILNPRVWEFGVGYASRGRSPTRYWVQTFGHRFDTYPIVINNEAARTMNTAVDLYIYGCRCPREGARPTGEERVSARSGRAGDIAPGVGGYDRDVEMRLSNNGIDWTSWEPYQSYRTWTLTPGTGTRQVHVELRTAGKIVKTKDIIMLAPADTDATGRSAAPKVLYGKRG
jgi:hypothetical protein